MNNFRYILRAVIEFDTPFIVGSGNDDIVSDAVCVTDCNGLPAIPGSSIAGALRAAYKAKYKNDANEIFGFQRGNLGEGSRLQVSWAVIHNSQDRPVEGFIGNNVNDAVLINAMNPKIRDHVKLTHLGTSDADKHGKFDDKAVCAGHRFTFELELVDDGTLLNDWENLIKLLKDGALRLGGNTRSGYGDFSVKSIYDKKFDLTVSEQRDAYLNHPVSLAAGVNYTVIKKDDGTTTYQNTTKVFNIKLKPEGFWFFGGGDDIANGKIDMNPVRDSYVKWDGTHGAVFEDCLIIPGAGIKGAISHRVAFHYNALNGNAINPTELLTTLQLNECANDEDRKKKIKIHIEKYCGENNAAVKELFGFAKDNQNAKDGKRGRVMINDIYIKENAPADKILNHVTIDRYTGGALDTALFDEKPLWNKGGNNSDFSLQLRIVVEDYSSLDAVIQAAFEKTLDDLCKGRLQMGAGSGRGNGYFTGKMEESKDV